MTKSLFDSDERPALAARLAPLLQSWAEKGVFVGTSSWKYPGWLDQIYSESRYITRGRFSKAKFEDNCLKEYAETFVTVCGDFTFYQFPSPETWEKLFIGLPPRFDFGLKVPEAVTVIEWPGHARYGAKANQTNDQFLDPTLFEDALLKPLQSYRERIGVLIFEFGAFAKRHFSIPAAFISKLDTFLKALPPGWRYAVEIRNREYLNPDYLSVLASHNVAHVFNAWTHMPPLAEQILMPGAFTTDLVVVRALLRKGRTYDQAVKLFEPYESVKEPDASTRTALRAIAEQCVRERRKAYMFVNNRLEGSAPQTIEAVLS